MIKGMFTLEIVVTDLKSSARWYEEKLGLTVGNRVNNEDGDWCELNTSSGEKSGLALWQPPNAPSAEKQVPASFVPILQVENLVQFVDGLNRAGVNVFDVKERKGYRLATIKDMEGNQLQLYEGVE